MHNQVDDDIEVAADNTEALQAELAELTATGADGADPVRFRYIQSLAARCEQADLRVTGFLLQKAWAALRSYQAVIDARPVHAIDPPVQIHKQSAKSALSALVDELDASNLDCDSATQVDAPVTSEVCHSAEGTDSPRSGNLRELKAAQFFRETLQQQRADTLLSRAILDAPEDSGPLNPQKLALRSLIIMRDLSPAYLSHFVSYVDTLLWLEAIDHLQPEFKASKRQTKANGKR